MNKIPWPESIWFFDIDDTLIDTAKTSIKASEGIKKIFESKYKIDIANQIQQNFNQIFQSMLNGHQSQSSSQEILSKIESCQQKTIQEYGIYKKWSREVFIKLAADQISLKVPSQIIQQAADEYWSVLTQKTTVLPHVLDLLKHIKKHQRPIFLITGSDARLQMDQNGQFNYDPKYSESLKKQRIEKLKSKGIIFDGLSIGDPEDKPHLDFFKKAIKLAENKLKKTIDYKNCLMLGDSFTGDLQTPKEKLNFGLVVLFKEGKKNTEIIDDQEVHLGDISKITDFVF